MLLSSEDIREIETFYQNSDFDSRGAVITDLDGTVVHEFEGRTILHKTVQIPLKKIFQKGRPVIINSLRFPLSVMRTLGEEWYSMSGNSIPVILLNGSQLGIIHRQGKGFIFEQLYSETLRPEEINTVVRSIQRFLAARITDFILFFYPEDWEKGEIIWTPVPEKIPALREKYASASSVISTDIEKLEAQLKKQPVCMIFLLIEAPDDQLMAYQHTRKNNFITHTGVDKAYGTRKMAELLNFSLEDSIGAGDSEMDNFLKETGMAISVGSHKLPFKGKKLTLNMLGFPYLGELFEKIATLQRTSITAS